MESNRKSSGKIIIIGEGVDLHTIPSLDSADLVLTFELTVESKLKEKNIPALYFHRYAQSSSVWSAAVAAAREWLEKWPTKPIYNGQSAVEFFRFEDTSLWWFIYDSMWETKNGIFDTFYHVKALMLLIQEYKPAMIEMHGVFDFNAQEIMNTMEKVFSFELKTINYVARAGSRNELTRSTGKLRLLARFLLLKAAKVFSKRGKERPIVFFLNHGSTAVERYHNGAYIINDHYLEGFEGYMTQNARRRLLISLNPPNVSSSFVNNLIVEIGRTARGLYTPWLCYFSLSDLERRRRLVGYYQSKITGLENDSGFKESMIVDGIDIYPMLKDVFRGNLPRALALVHSEILLARRFLDKEQPSIVFHTSGISASGRALCFACRERNIRIVAPQLGIISPQLPVNTSFLITERYDRRLLSEYLVWGPFYKTLITDRGYPESLVKVAGFWRTEKDQSQQDMISSHMHGDFILYVAGANLGKLSYILSFDEEIMTIRLIHKSIKDKLGLLVKLHPSLPYDKYHNALQDIINDITLVGGPGVPGIEKFLPAAKIVVGKASTVLVQALILGKPVIAVNFGSELDFLGFQGVPFVTTPEEFAENVNIILNDRLQDFNLKNYCDPIGRDSISLVISEIEK